MSLNYYIAAYVHDIVAHQSSFIRRRQLLNLRLINGPKHLTRNSWSKSESVSDRES